MNMLKKITRKNHEIFLKRYASAERALDIGAGGSSYGRFFPNRVSVDIDPQRKPDVVADAHNLPFKDGEFNLVVCTEVLEHVRDPRRVMSEIHRVLEKGGKIILTTRFVYPLHDTPHDYWRYTKYGLGELFKDFKVIEIVPESQSFTTIAILLQRIAYQSKLRFNKIAKLKLFVLAWIIRHFDWLIVEEYADIKKSAIETDIMPSGYYIAAEK